MQLKPGDMLRVGPMTFLISDAKSVSAPEPGGSADSPSPKPKPAEEKSTGDDLIAAWLSEGGDIEESGNDTTIDISSPVSSPADAASASSENTLQSVRDRAQEIIRRWQKEQGKG